MNIKRQFYGVGMVGGTNFGVMGVFIFLMGVIANVIFYYICWVWLIGTYFSNNRL
jgi:hypothetical protein